MEQVDGVLDARARCGTEVAGEGGCAVSLECVCLGNQRWNLLTHKNRSPYLLAKAMNKVQR